MVPSMLLVSLLVGATNGVPIKFAAVPFNLSLVQLAPGSLYAKMEQRNFEFLLGLESDRLLCLHTAAANLTGTFANPTCSPYDHPQYWGHYLGHYLSATALSVQSAPRDVAEKLKAKSAGIVTALGHCQDAWTAKGDGYHGFLYPYDRVSFDRLFNTPFRNCDPVCVPFYVMHKMMAGLLDQYLRAGNEKAFDIVKAMAAWVKPEIDAILARPGGEAQWQRILNTEWGGMNEVLYNLYAVTGDPDHLKAGQYFNHYQWTAPLAVNQDDLDASHGNNGGSHANTHIPEIIGSERGYEMTGNMTQRKIAANFFSIVTTAHSFSTGGSNAGEHWTTPHRMGDQLNAGSYTEESCTTYNILKVARHLFEWSADASLADFYERALLNGLAGNQNRLKPEMTSFIYMLPLGGFVKKPWGPSDKSFACCWGTLSEQFSKLGDSIMFRSPPNDVLYVNLFASATVSWPERGVTVSLDADAFPTSTTSTGTFKIKNLSRQVNDDTWTLMIRVPYWAASGKNTATLNGKPLSVVAPGSYIKIGPRAWSINDTVSFHFPMTLHFEQLDDDRSEWKGIGSILYGPLMLASVGSHITDRLAVNISDLEGTIKRNSTSQLSFEASSGSFCSDGPTHLVPFNTIVEEEYVVYFHTSADGPTINASIPALLPAAAQKAWNLYGGAGILPASSGYDIRSGDPHQEGEAELGWPIFDAAHRITGLKFGYNYLSGYGINPTTSGTGSNFSLILKPCKGTGGPTTLYASPELVEYPHDKCQSWPDCYSPTVHVEASSLDVSASTPSSLALEFHNNDRNLQIHLPLNFTITWSNGVETMLVVGRRVRPHEFPSEPAELPVWGVKQEDPTIIL